MVMRFRSDGFALPRSAFERDVPPGGKSRVFGTAAIACGFQAYRQPPGTAALRSESSFLRRAFLGEHWDYLVKPREGALTLKVTTSPFDDFAVGAAAWLEFEPRQMAAIA